MTTPQIIIVSIIFAMDCYCSIYNPIMRSRNKNDIEIVLVNSVRMVFVYVAILLMAMSINDYSKNKPIEKYTLIKENVYIKN